MKAVVTNTLDTGVCAVHFCTTDSCFKNTTVHIHTLMDQSPDGGGDDDDYDRSALQLDGTASLVMLTQLQTHQHTPSALRHFMGRAHMVHVMEMYVMYRRQQLKEDERQLSCNIMLLRTGDEKDDEQYALQRGQLARCGCVLDKLWNLVQFEGVPTAQLPQANMRAAQAYIKDHHMDIPLVEE